LIYLENQLYRAFFGQGKISLRDWFLLFIRFNRQLDSFEIFEGIFN